MKKTILFVALISIILPLNAVLADENSDQNKLQNIQSQLAVEKQKLKITKLKEQRALTGLYVIKSNLRRAQKSLNEAKGRVVYNKKQITELKKNLSGAEKKLDIEGRTLRKRINEVYKSGSGGLLDILFASKSMSDFVNRTYYFGRVIGRDVELINNIREQVATIKNTRQQLETSNVEIKDSLKSIEQEKRSIAQSTIEQERAYQILKNKRHDYESRIRKLEESSIAFEKFIRARGKSTAVSTGRFSWPIIGRIVSGFGYRRHPIWGGIHLHTGIDIAAPFGKPISAADGGECIFSGWWDGYGKAVVIDHGRGYTTVYGHQSRIYVQVGQKIEKGQVIGLVGSTGFSTGPHLHFEVRVNGKVVNPMPYLI